MPPPQPLINKYLSTPNLQFRNPKPLPPSSTSQQHSLPFPTPFGVSNQIRSSRHSALPTHLPFTTTATTPSYCHTLCHSTPIAPCMQPHVELNPQSDLPTLHFCLSLSSPHGWPLALHASRRVSLHSIRSRPSTARARRVSGQLTARVPSPVDFSTRLSSQTTRSDPFRSHRRVPGPSSWRQTCSATCWPH